MLPEIAHAAVPIFGCSAGVADIFGFSWAGLLAGFDDAVSVFFSWA
jgi:hypothetical protein